MHTNIEKYQRAIIIKLTFYLSSCVNSIFQTILLCKLSVSNQMYNVQYLFQFFWCEHKKYKTCSRLKDKFAQFFLQTFVMFNLFVLRFNLWFNINICLLHWHSYKNQPAFISDFLKYTLDLIEGHPKHNLYKIIGNTFKYHSYHNNSKAHL